MLADLCTGRRNASKPPLQNHHKGSAAVGEEDRQVDVLRPSHGIVVGGSGDCRSFCFLRLFKTECVTRVVSQLSLCSVCQMLSAAGLRHLLGSFSAPFALVMGMAPFTSMSNTQSVWAYFCQDKVHSSSVQQASQSETQSAGTGDVSHGSRAY